MDLVDWVDVVNPVDFEDPVGPGDGGERRRVRDVTYLPSRAFLRTR